jgi:hypothetical protein
VLLDTRARQRGITDPAAVAALIDGHAAGAVEGGDALWSLLNLELWYRTFIDGEGIQTLPTLAPGVQTDAPAHQPCESQHEDSLVERRPAAAARQGRQAAHVARHAPPGEAARHHLRLVRGCTETEADRAG